MIIKNCGLSPIFVPSATKSFSQLSYHRSFEGMLLFFMVCIVKVQLLPNGYKHFKQFENDKNIKQNLVTRSNIAYLIRTFSILRKRT